MRGSTSVLPERIPNTTPGDPAGDRSRTTVSHRSQRRRPPWRRWLVLVLALAAPVGVTATPEPTYASTWYSCDGNSSTLLGRNESGGIFVRGRMSCRYGTPVVWVKVLYRQLQADSVSSTEWITSNRLFRQSDGSIMAQWSGPMNCPRGYEVFAWSWGGYSDTSGQRYSIPGAWHSTGRLVC